MDVGEHYHKVITPDSIPAFFRGAGVDPPDVAVVPRYEDLPESNNASSVKFVPQAITTCQLTTWFMSSKKAREISSKDMVSEDSEFTIFVYVYDHFTILSFSLIPDQHLVHVSDADSTLTRIPSAFTNRAFSILIRINFTFSLFLTILLLLLDSR